MKCGGVVLFGLLRVYLKAIVSALGLRLSKVTLRQVSEIVGEYYC